MGLARFYAALHQRQFLNLSLTGQPVAEQRVSTTLRARPTMTSTKKSRPARRPVKAGARPDRSANPLPFDWPLANEAEQLLRERIVLFLERNTYARQLADRMRDETGTDLFEWVDHIVLAPEEQKALREAGFVPDPQAETPKGETVYEHPRATLPRVKIGRASVAER